MFCNKDEAGRAKELAEKKFAEKDLGGAKRFALMAQRLYSDLDGLHQLLVTLDVHVSFGEKINDEVDWYRVLGVEPLADDDTIRRHYRKLALVIHPDKNKSVGAEGAFHIIHEAWSLLSDKSKRTSYDQKRKGIIAESVIPKSSPSVPTGENQFRNFASNNNLNEWNQSIPPFFRCPAPHLRFKPNTFWTTCEACKTQFEYLRVFIDLCLLCPCCRRPFVAIETPPPPSNYFSTSWSNYMQQKNSGQTIVNENSYSLGRKPASASIARPAGSSGVSTGLSSAASGSLPKGDKPKKRRRKDEQRKNNQEKEISKQVSRGNRGVCMFGSLLGLGPGVGYLFGSISHVIKKNMGYNQRKICILGVAKVLGEFVGFLAGGLVEVFPIWAIMLIGAVLNFVGVDWNNCHSNSLKRTSEVFDEDMGSAKNSKGEMINLLKIGLSCCEEDVDSRMELKEVVEKIERGRS
ncbi:hypothetical protein Dsin_030429 [Dipteronia sinensis]|uniref:J domain-containing protein n=1 Tax=Dipteronia sinensis TaxID=43782 RepID=A0AAD9ZJ38_9ROSI|nr:hypothetical protein Dsin_030429 [Dipteronia sinensis]